MYYGSGTVAHTVNQCGWLYSNSKEFKVNSAEHCSHCTKKTKHQEKKEKTEMSSV